MNPSMPDASSNHSHTTLVHSTAYRAPATRGRPARTRTAKDGSSQTGWCTQVIGLTRHVVSPVRANAVAHSPTATARRTRLAHTHSTSRTATAHTRRDEGGRHQAEDLAAAETDGKSRGQHSEGASTTGGRQATLPSPGGGLRVTGT